VDLAASAIALAASAVEMAPTGAPLALGSLTLKHYRRIADTALPHWRDRPLTMQRFPDGIGRNGFFQKDMPDFFPDWIDRVELDKQGGSVTHVVVNDAARLAYIANLACITGWDEVSARSLGPRKYTVKNIFRRLAQTGDPWSSIDSRARPLDDVRTRLARMA